MTNLARAGEILTRLWREGARDLVLCAGARNAPFVTLLARETPFRVHSFFDERSAAFFALGKMQATERPVAVLTTSGTAAAELLPATIEADYQALPLILITADRPRRYRGTGAPQAIVQPGLYSHYVELEFDLEYEPLPEWEWSARRPLHLNVCFDEPLLDGHAELHFTDKGPRPSPVPAETRAIHFAGTAPLVLLGAIPPAERSAVRATLRAWRRPLYAEATSGLRGDPELAELEVRGGEKALAEIKHDSVIRIGRVPTLRLWRDLETSDLPVLNFSDTPFSGLPRAREVHSYLELRAWKMGFAPGSGATARAKRLERLLREYQCGEPAWFRFLSECIPDGARVFLGNSLPIREWDLAAARARRFEIFANRGVNGIDGLISTFLGLADAAKSNWAVMGDLSALYDLNAGWAARALKLDLNLVVINNGGGEIFKRMFRNELFENRHGLSLEPFARLWDWDYLRLAKPLEIPEAAGPRLIEIFPDIAQSESFWTEWNK